MQRGYVLASLLVLINFINPTFELMSDHYMSLAVLRQSIMAKVKPAIIAHKLGVRFRQSFECAEQADWQNRDRQTCESSHHRGQRTRVPSSL